ncbi:MAG TPA: hypothetical protein VKW76_01425 [Candidatus Binatia bacterium]|nr:hypothetical protein [Candidatus Binatia bacterium]
MRRRARACSAVSLGGWLLLSPPLREKAGVTSADLDAPESAWTHVSTHDTLAQCEEARTAIREDAKKRNLDIPVILRRQRADHDAGAQPNPALARLLALQLARCVPAERLGPPAAARDPSPPR